MSKKQIFYSKQILGKNKKACSWKTKKNGNLISLSCNDIDTVYKSLRSISIDNTFILCIPKNAKSVLEKIYM